MEWIAFALFFVVFLCLLSGYPVAFTLAGVSLIFAFIGIEAGAFSESFFTAAITNRLYGIIDNSTLIAVPLFVFMGIMLERSKIAESLLETMAGLFGSIKGGLGISVIIVGMLMAASTGIVGATVVTMGLLSLPTMLKHGYNPSIATGAICASGTLGQIIPPSIVLVLLGDVLSSAYQQAQLNMGIFSPDTLSVGDLFIGAVIPGLLLVIMYMLYLIVIAFFKPEFMPCATNQTRPTIKNLIKVLVPPLSLIIAVLGSIIAGIATPTEAASVGALGAILLAASHKKLNLAIIKDVSRATTRVTCMVFMILIGAAFFSLVFRGFGGDDAVHAFLSSLPGGKFTAILIVMLVLFLLGFVLDFIEITFIVIPIVGPILLSMGVNPVWLGIMIAINLQTSFLTPPFGFALFYLRGVAPKSVSTGQIYKGVMPFIGIQIAMLIILAAWPQLATWLPTFVYAN